MSRVGKKNIPIPEKTKIKYQGKTITVTGERGTLSRTIHHLIDLDVKADTIAVTIKGNDRRGGAFQGLTRSLVANMITGVNQGFTRVLEINGIGYRATISGSTITLNIGYSNPVDFTLPEGITATVDKKNAITLSGIDKELVGTVAAAIRRLRPPEPYKGKGIKYAEEYVQRKAGKAGAA